MGLLARLMVLAARRPLAVGLVVAVVALAGAAVALRLEPTTATRTLVGTSSASWQATEREHALFGDDAVYVLVRGDVSKLVLTRDLDRLIGLEGCLSGNAPAGAAPKGPCAELARRKPAQVVFGPGTFINEAVRQIGEQYTAQLQRISADGQAKYDAAYALAKGKGYSDARAKAAAAEIRRLAELSSTKDALKLALRYGILAPPTINDPGFVAQLVFASGQAAGTPKARFAYLFPNARSALVQVRLRPDLDAGERRRAIELIRAAVAMPDWRPVNGGRYVVTGAPVVLDDLTDEVTGSIGLLLVAAVAVMALALALVFRARVRLLPLVVALAACAITFGALSLAGASLTMASIGVLPVLLGLAVDYAVQLQSRIEERARRRRADVPGAVAAVARDGAPTVAVAAAATAAGFAVLALSPVPMVRGFGLLLVAGIGVALVTAMTLGVAAYTLATRRATPRPIVRRRSTVAAPSHDRWWVGPAVRGAADLLAGSLRAVTRRPGRVLAVAVLVAAAGWALDTQTRVESDVAKLVPQDLRALRDLQALQDDTGVGGQIDVLVQSDKLTDPAVIAWMTRYQAEVLERFDYTEARGCGRAELCPAFSLPDLFGADGAKTSTQIDALLDAVPPYFSQAVLTRDRRAATMAFGIRLMPLERQEEVIEAMRARLHPPAGVTARLAGLPVLAADAHHAVASPWRRLVTLLAGLVAVAIVLLVALRSWRRALVPLVPIVLATGWSALLLFLTRVPLNPMSVTLGALVVAISTEFSVLLAERYRSERRAGLTAPLALERTYRSTGRAVLASGVTAIAGFAVLALSDIRMLRDFGAVTVIDLTVSLLGVLVVLPAVLLLAERPRPVGLRLPRLRRPARTPAA